MLEYLKNFLHDFKYESDDIDILINSYSVIISNLDASVLMEELLKEYNNDMYTSWDKQTERMDRISSITGIHSYTVSFIACILLSEKLKDYYLQNGLSFDLWHDTITDLKYKLKECKLVKGICGTFVRDWYYKFFTLNLFALGRLQFRINNLRYDYIKNNYNLKKGDEVVDIHIPRTETPLDRQSCIESYNMAKEFFKEKFYGKPMPFVCSSWLLAEENKEMLSEKSNIRKFMNDFDIIHKSYYPHGDYSETWRLFDMDYTGNIDDFPENSSFRKEYKNYLKNGGRIGSAYGIFIL